VVVVMVVVDDQLIMWRAARQLGDAIACKQALNGFGMDATRSMTSRRAIAAAEAL
jgi:hypothetical protein